MVTTKKAEYNIQQACLRFLQRLGDQATNPLLFNSLNEIADKDFDLKLDGANPSDVCFIKVMKPDKIADDKLYRRMINSKGKVYYVVEGQGHSSEEQGEA